MMRINYDKKEDAVYIRFHDSPYSESDEVRPGVIVDYDNQGRVIGLEVLGVSKNLTKSFLQDIQTQQVRLELNGQAMA